MTWRYFKRAEFACRHCGQNEIKDAFIDRLDALRAAVGFPLRITSGYRCPLYNQRVAGTGDDGPHTTGRAADILVDRGRAIILLREAFKLGFTGFGIKQHGTVRYIHLDDLEDGRPTLWSY
jgi:uncharacterized protein YcbK (DUF882 family)